MVIHRPIVFIDLETTGKDVNTARIVEIGLIKIGMDGTKEEKRHLINPGMPIPPSATEIHGITDTDVQDKPPFKKIAKAMFEYLDGCDLSGYNLDKFDIPLLVEEFALCGIDYPPKDTKIVDVIKIERLHNSHKLSDTYERYFNKKLEGAHGALTDAKASLEILMEILDRHYSKETTVDKLHELLQGDEVRVDYAGKLAYNENGDIVWAFGPHFNKPVLEDIGFFNWVMSKDFPAETKRILSRHQRQKFDEQQQQPPN